MYRLLNKRNHLLSITRKASSLKNLVIAKEVLEATAQNRPVVALESTIISHGMPYPQNLECALQIEELVRSEGAIPATVALMDGVPHVGLTHDQLFLLAKNQAQVKKASTKDLGYCMAKGFTAATTVASTMTLAHQANIRVFATGGIGGVHRGVEETMDISADLFELSHTPVTVVCAGIKSILDIAKSLEVLETYAVPVLGYRTTTFPAFFTNDSGISVSQLAQSSDEVARIMFSHYDQLRLSSGMVVAVPNPQPADSVLINHAIQEALHVAKQSHITGAEITPFLLSYIEKLTHGMSLQSNIALVENNARIATQIAKDYCKIHQQKIQTRPQQQQQQQTPIQSVGQSDIRSSVTTSSLESHQSSSPAVKKPSVMSEHNEGNTTTTPPSVVVVGGAVTDLIGTLRTNSPTSNAPFYPPSSYPGSIARGIGGVGHNIANKLAHKNIPTALITALGDDSPGREILNNAKQNKIDMKYSKIVKSSSATSISTASYVAIHHSNKDLYVGLADMEIFKELTPQYFTNNHDILALLERCRLLVLDGNISTDTFYTLASLAKQFHVPVFFEPTSNHKCILPFEAQSIGNITIMKPNLSELIAMVTYSLTDCSPVEQTAYGRIIQKYHRHHHSSTRIDDSIGHSSEKDSLVNAVGLNLQEVELLTARLLSSMTKSFTQSNISSLGDNLSTKTITGKHVFVSMGKYGLCWAHNNPFLYYPIQEQFPPEFSSSFTTEDGQFIGGVHYISLQNASLLNEKLQLTVDEMLKSTNGAGDAFCSGLIAHILNDTGDSLSSTADSRAAYREGREQQLHLPNLDSVLYGLREAKNHLLKA